MSTNGNLLSSAIAGYLDDKVHRPDLLAAKLAELIELARDCNESTLANCLLSVALLRDAGQLELKIGEAALKHGLAKASVDLSFAHPSVSSQLTIHPETAVFLAGRLRSIGHVIGVDVVATWTVDQAEEADRWVRRLRIWRRSPVQIGQAPPPPPPFLAGRKDGE